MKIVLFNKNLYTLHLPSKIDGSFCLTDISNNDEILANIEENNKKWMMNVTANYKILYNNNLLESVELLPYKFYILSSKNSQKLIYVEDSIDSSFKMYKIENNIQFVVGKNSDNQLSYANNLVLGQHLALFYKDGTWSTQLAPKASIYINQRLINDEKIELKNGDVIFIYGLKIIIMGNIIMINNPNNSVVLNNNVFKPYEIYQEKLDYDEPREVDYYNEDDYFFKTPRLRRFIDTYELKFANPPSQEKKEDLPLILVLGPSLTMAIISFTMLLNVISNITGGKTTFAASWTRIISCVAMLMASLLWPNLIRRYNKKKMKEKNLERQEKYRLYLEKKKKEMISEGINQTEILKENLLSLDDCYQIIINRKRTLWERKISQRDFLTVRVGTGDIPIDMDIQFNEDEFTIEEDELKKEAETMVNEHKKLVKVPVGYSFYNKKATAIMGIADKLNSFVSNLILQLITFHSYDDLKIVILTSKKNEATWLVYKNLPHCFSNNRQIRFFATDIEEMKTVSNYLEQEYISRVPQNADANTEVVENEDKDNSVTYSPYYLIFTDDFTKVRRLGISELILKNKDDFGFGFVIIENSLGKLPSECVNFITIGNQTSGILRNELDDYYHQDFNDEVNAKIDIHKCCEVLANIPIEFYEDTRYLPKNLGFLEMLRVGKVEQLNSLNRWRLNDPTKSLRAAVGINDLGNIIYLDLHEKYHGPHGLIAGMTGSGKSEFIITYILSMCINYHPYEVQFVLIDYKGGGLAGAFQNKETGIKIPHLVGTITNLDTAEMNRTLVSIESELKRRQKIFNETKDMLGESTIDIYKYQRLYREGSVKEPMAHLFIISDEFAELKSQQPEFMQQLISTARIGRSLGVHLILATQKPSGVVNDQIWSNSKFKVCLKVQDRSDSMEMLKKPDAASIKEAGRFYLQVGYDDFFDKGQSGWAGAKYVPSDKLIKKVDDSIDFIDNIGNITKSIKDVVKVNNDTIDYGDQLTNIVKSIYQLGEKEQIRTKGLWLDAIPEKIYIDDLKKKYNYKPEYYFINPVIGEYDNPSAQEQGLLNLNMTCRNTAIYGQVGSGKENLLSTIIWSTCIEHTPEEVNMYIIDCGSEALKKFINMPHVGDVATIEEQEKVFNTMVMVEEEIEKRKDLMVDYGGSYQEYIDNSGKKLPLIVVIINNYEVFTESFSRLSDSIQNFYRDGAKYGIVFVVSAISVNTIKMRMLQNFTNKLCLQIPNVADYRGVVNAKRGQIPSKLFGRGLVATETTALEFQTAMFCDKKNLTNFVISAAKQLSAAYSYKAKSILVMPDVVTKEILSENKKDISAMPIGIAMDSISPCLYDFTSNKITNILASELQREQLSFVKVLIDFFYQTPNLILNILDLGAVFKSIYTDNNYYANDFDNAILNINNIIMNNKQGDKSIITIVVCAGLLKSKLNSNGIAILNNLFNKLPEIDNSYFVFIDTYNSIRNLQTDIWYQNNVNNTYGIWLGEGIGNQVAININDLSVDHRKAKFPYMAFVVNKGKYEIIKHITENGE